MSFPRIHRAVGRGPGSARGRISQRVTIARARWCASTALRLLRVPVEKCGLTAATLVALLAAVGCAGIRSGPRFAYSPESFVLAVRARAPEMSAEDLVVPFRVTPEMVARARDITSGAQTDWAKAERLIKSLTDEVHPRPARRPRRDFRHLPPGQPQRSLHRAPRVHRQPPGRPLRASARALPARRPCLRTLRSPCRPQSPGPRPKSPPSVATGTSSRSPNLRHVGARPGRG